MRGYVTAVAAALIAVSTASAADRERDRDRDNDAEDVAERMAAPLVQEAGGYALYQEDVSTLEATPFGSVEDIDRGLEVVASHSPERLGRAWIAYSALVAAQSPAFADGVRQSADYYGRDAMIAGLRNDPAYAGQVSGADTARQAVLTAVSNDVTRLREVSATVKNQAYSLQSQDWADAQSDDSDIRIAWLDQVALQARFASSSVLENLAAPGAVGSDRVEELASASASFWSAFRLGPSTALAAVPGELPVVMLTANPSHQNAIDQIVTLAALEALDAANSSDALALSPLLNEPSTQMCMTMARLHFQQCVAASHYRYEDPFCIAEHGVKDVGDCFSKVVNQ
jgi:hypothetical protein